MREARSEVTSRLLTQTSSTGHFRADNGDTNTRRETRIVRLLLCLSKGSFAFIAQFVVARRF